MNDYLPGLAGVPATKSTISDIDGERGVLTYRGYPIEQLAEFSTFEETAYLLLYGQLPAAQELREFDRELRDHRRLKYQVREIMKHLPANGHPMEILQTTVACLGMFYPADQRPYSGRGEVYDPEFIRRTTLRIIGCMGTLVTVWEHIRNGYDPVEPCDEYRYARNFLFMLTGREPDPLLARIFDVCLILHAEHTINASTFAVLVNGSTLASPYSVVASAIGTLSGPLHGGANQKVIEMLREIETPAAARAYVEQKLARKEVIWGMGHREYKTKDPRAKILQGLMAQVIDSNLGDEKLRHMFEVAQAVEQVAEEHLARKGVYANVDFYSGTLYSAMGIPADQFTSVFAIARVVGWLAHWREQLADNRIFRPTQVYAGEAVRNYVSLERR